MSPRAHRPRPLRWHLVRLVLGTLLPIVALACGLFFLLARAERETAERRALTSARSLAEALDSELAGSLRALDELAARIRERLGGQAPVFAALTGYGQQEDRARSEAAGFRHHFVKPVQLKELVAFLEAQRAERRGAA